MGIKTLDEKFTHELGDVYDAEHRFLKAMQEMQGKATDSNLQSMLQTHISETEQQIKNVEQIFQLLGEKPKRETCDGSSGIISEGQKAMKEGSENPQILDCFIADSMAKSEHYEMSTYRGLIMGAEQMGNQDVVQLLRQNLEQEEKTAQLVEKSVPTLLQKAMQAQ